MNKEEAKEIIDKISKEEFPYALAIAKAYEKLEQENKQLKDNNKKVLEYLYRIDMMTTDMGIAIAVSQIREYIEMIIGDSNKSGED